MRASELRARLPAPHGRLHGFMEEPQRKRVDARTVAAIEHTGPYDHIPRVYHRLFAWAREQGVTPEGEPFTVFHAAPGSLDWDNARFEVCLPVPEGTEGSDGVRVRTLAAIDVLAVEVTGPYSEIPAHYAEFAAWLDWQTVRAAGPPREIYLVHPGPDGSGDPATFRTEIQFPVAEA